jgi:hypothetical protein
MSSETSRARQPLYTQIDVGSSAFPPVAASGRGDVSENTLILRDILAAQDRQNELMEEMLSQMSMQSKQRTHELGQWKQANPRLARNCRNAAESLGKIQTEFLDSLTNEINTNFDTLVDGEYMLNEFIDKYGPRMAHLNGLLQVLAMLGAAPNPTNAPNPQ